MRMRSVHKSVHHKAICSLGPGVGNLILFNQGTLEKK